MSSVWRRCFVVAIIFLSSHVATGALVRWRPNTSFNLPLNFQDGKLPCGRQTVYFPETLISSVRITSEIDVGSLELPLYGALDLSDGSAMFFGPEPTKDVGDCVEGDVYYTEKSTLGWLQADAWQSDRFNDATPDAERIPCFDDDVLFPQDSQFSIKLPDETQYVRSISIGGAKVTRERFEEIAENSQDQPQSFELNSATSSGVAVERRACAARAGCACQRVAPHVDCSLKACDVPRCREPVLPEGACCHICGGVLKFQTNVNTFNLLSFKKSVATTVDEYGGAAGIVYHVGVLADDRVQVVMTDRAEYAGASALAVRALDRSLAADVTALDRQSLLSGAPRGSEGVAAEVVGLALLAAALVFAAIYVWYQRPDALAVPLPRLPARPLASFSRFQNRAGSMASLESTGVVDFRTSFTNPIYDSKRGKSGRSTPEASTSTEPAPAAAAHAAVGAGASTADQSKPDFSVDSITRMSNLVSLDE